MTLKTRKSLNRTCLRSARVDVVEDGLADLAVRAELLEALRGHSDVVGQGLDVRFRGDDDGDSALSADWETNWHIHFLMK